MKNETNNAKYTLLVATLCTTVLISGCEDIQYDFDIPSQDSHCDVNGLDYRTLPDVDIGDLDGGSVIRDRDGGSGIRDRYGDLVKEYCHRECAGGTPVGHIVVEWQNQNKYVEGFRVCATP